MRDIKRFTISPRIPGGMAPNPEEIYVAVHRWPTGNLQLVDTLAHELHHTARWQNDRAGRTLGDALVFDGMACLFAEKTTGFKAPWTKQGVTKEIIRAAGKSWNSKNYNPDAWYFRGSLGRWALYRLGYRLAKAYAGAVWDGEFDLPQSIMVRANALRPYLNRIRSSK